MEKDYLFFLRKISLVCLMAYMYILDAGVYNIFFIYSLYIYYNAEVYNIFIIYSMYIILDFSSTAEAYCL